MKNARRVPLSRPLIIDGRERGSVLVRVPPPLVMERISTMTGNDQVLETLAAITRLPREVATKLSPRDATEITSAARELVHT